MPSEADRTPAVLAALTPASEPFETALAATIEELRGFLASHRMEDSDTGMRAEAELGAFGTGRIDAQRFSSLLAPRESTDVETIHMVERALATLTELRERANELFVVRVPEGGDVRGTVARALAEAGRAFGVARALRFIWNGVASTSVSDPRDAFPPWRWNAAERELAPPIVVQVQGAGLNAAGLGDLLEGQQKIVLVIEEPAPIAPLARLLTPGLFVTQTEDLAQVAESARWDGPALAAVVPPGSALFTHRPGANSFYARMDVQALPTGTEGRGLGRFGAERDAKDLAHLTELTRPEIEAVHALEPAVRVSLESDRTVPPLASAPVDHLAGWLLVQAGLDGGA